MFFKKIIRFIKKDNFFSRISAKIFWKTRRLFYAYFNCLKIDSNKFVFDNFNGHGFSDNPKYVLLEIHKRNPAAKLIWLYNDFNYSTYEFPEYVKVVYLKSFTAMKEMYSARFWIFNTRNFYELAKKKGQIYIQTWHGSLGPKKIEQDAENFLSEKYVESAKKDSSQIDVCISGTRHLTKIYQNGFWYKGNVLESGSPRNDLLFKTEQIGKLKEKLNFKDEKICLYAPTFRKDHKLDNYNLDCTVLKTTLESTFGGKWKILIRLHPAIADKLGNNLIGFDLNVSKYPDCQELLLISDCLITDYSSIIYDYAIQNKPAFIFAPDYENYKRNERNLYFNLEDTPFYIAQTNEELAISIKSFDLNSFIERKKAFLIEKGCFDKGDASKIVVNLIEQKFKE